MLIFYRATVESILWYSKTSRFGHLTVKSIAQILGPVKTAGKIMGMPPPSPQDLFKQTAIRLASDILSDTSHVLCSEYVLLNSGRRYSAPLCEHIPLIHPSLR